jgi:branched-chain amino acid transport system substrate-binding protein
VKLGFITEGQGVASDGRPEIPSAQSAARYVNEYLNGVAGHPISLEVCETGNTPAGAATCANKMVASGVPIVLQSAPGNPVPVLTALEKVKIPYFTYATVEQKVLLSPDAYVLTNTLGGLAAPIQLAKDSGAKHVAVLVYDVPAAAGPVKALGGPLYKKAGLDVDFIAVAPGTPDMTPQVQSAISKGADEFAVLGDPGFCVSGLSALSTLGFEGDRIVNTQCLGPDSAKSIPGGLAGVKVATTESLDASDPEVALYEAVLEHYAPKTPPHVAATSGAYAVVVALARALSGFNGELTKDAIPGALAAAAPAKMPLLDGQTFKCDRKTFSLTPAVCSAGMTIVTLDADGNAKDSKPFDSKPILQFGD